MGNLNPQRDQEEFCIECGQFVDKLDEYSGWCSQCSVNAGLAAPSCVSCGGDLNSPAQKLCARCKYERWLVNNADAIERVMATQKVSVRAAKRIVREYNRPICLSCKNPIKGGQRDRHFFCTKRPECVKAHTAYSYHIRNKPQQEAIQLAITASLIYKLTADINEGATEVIDPLSK